MRVAFGDCFNMEVQKFLALSLTLTLSRWERE